MYSIQAVLTSFKVFQQMKLNLFYPNEMTPVLDDQYTEDEALPRTHGRIIHSTVVGLGPWRLGSAVTMCCEASRRRKRKLRQDAVWQMNLMKGLRMKRPIRLLGATRQQMDKRGKRRPMKMHVMNLPAQWRLLQPGNSSYQREARSC